MDWMNVLNTRQQGFNDYISLLMQINADKHNNRIAGLQNEKEKLMLDENFDPDVKQNFIDSLLYDSFGIETKNTKGVKINEALNKIEKEIYGGYENVYDEGNNQRKWLAKQILGEYDPNRKETIKQNAAIMQDAVNQHGEQFKEAKDNAIQKVKSGFEPPSDEFLKIIQAQNRDKMNRHKR